MKQNSNLTVALYERLSHDDEQQGESFSISNQKLLLETYAREHGMNNYKHFFDDGISGTRFDRPGFMAMMNGIKDGEIGTVIVKDMSRLGRDYLMVGQIQEMLRQKNVRLIAINDNHDSIHGDDDLLPFKNIMNEWYAVRRHIAGGANGILISVYLPSRLCSPGGDRRLLAEWRHAVVALFEEQESCF